MRVAELVDLGLIPLSAHDPGLDREIRWVYTTDLPDPRPFIYGGELVLTSEGWYDGTEKSCSVFVDALVDRSAAALVVGDILHGEVPPPVVDSAAGRIPLLFAPKDISYNALSQHVMERIAKDRNDVLSATIGEYRQLIAALVSDADIGVLLSALTRQTGLAGMVIGVGGRLIASTLDTEASSSQRTGLARAALNAVRLPTVTTLGEDAVTVYPLGRRTALSGFLVMAGEINAWKARERRIVDESSDLLALGLIRDRDRFTQERLRVAHLVAAIEDEHSTDPELRRILRRLGLVATERLSVLSVASAGGSRVTELALELTLGAGVDEDAVVLTSTSDAEMVAFVGHRGSRDTERLIDELREHARWLAPMVRGGSVSIGVADAEQGTVRAVATAREARLLAAQQDTAIAVATGRDISSHRMMLAAVPAARRSAFRQRVLGPLLHPEEETAAQYLRTLESFLRHSGSWRRCAEELHIHVSTLHYRIEKIEKLLGRDLNTLADRVDCYLAFEC
jgi:hypothetical protein